MIMDYESDLTPEEEAKCIRWRVILLGCLNKAFQRALKKKRDDASNMLDELIDKAAEWQSELVEDSEEPIS